MTMDRYINAESPELSWMELWRCLACGNVVDPQIRINRLLQRALRERGAKIPSQRAWNRQMVKRLRDRATMTVQCERYDRNDGMPLTVEKARA
jgi:hypothetical protein